MGMRLRGGLLLLLLLACCVLCAGQALRPLPWLYHKADAQLGRGDAVGAIASLDSLRGARGSQPYEVYRLYTLAYLRVGSDDSVSFYLQRAAGVGSAGYPLLAAEVACQQVRVAEGVELLRGYLASRRAVAERRLRSDTLLRPCAASAGWADLWGREWYSISQVLDDDLEQRAEEGNWHYLLERLDQLSAYSRRRSKYAHLRALALRGIGDMEPALALALRNAKRSPRQLAYVVLAAELAVACDKPRVALRLLDRYRAYDPAAPGVLPVLSRARLGAGDLLGAYEAAARYLELYPQDRDCLYLALRAAMAAGRWMQALRAGSLLEACASADTVAYVQMQRARVHLALSQPRLALEALELAARVVPNDTLVHALAAESYGQLGDRGGECRAWARAAELGHRRARSLLKAKCPRRSAGGDAGTR